MKTIDELQAEIAGLKAILQDKDNEIKTLEKVQKENSEQISKLNKLNNWYMEQLKLKAKEKFGKFFTAWLFKWAFALRCGLLFLSAWSFKRKCG